MFKECIAAFPGQHGYLIYLSREHFSYFEFPSSTCRA